MDKCLCSGDATYQNKGDLLRVACRKCQYKTPYFKAESVARQLWAQMVVKNEVNKARHKLANAIAAQDEKDKVAATIKASRWGKFSGDLVQVVDESQHSMGFYTQMADSLTVIGGQVFVPLEGVGMMPVERCK